MVITRIRLARVRRALSFCVMRAEDLKIGHAPLTEQWRLARPLCEATRDWKPCS